MTRDDRHLSEEVFQGLLDGSLPDVEGAAVREHLASCARCRSELEGWNLLFRGLDDLEDVAPPAGFADRVLEALPDREPRLLPRAARLAARIKGWLTPWETASRLLPSRHVAVATVQDFLEGALPREKAIAVEEHLHGCRLCREEVAGWRALMVRLDEVPRVAPSSGFAERVMAHVRVQSALAVARPTTRERLANWLAALSPRTRKRLAGLAGAAVTPLATVALVGWVVFSHPLVTVGSLLSFVWLEAQDALAAGGAAVGGSLESGLLHGAWELVQAVGAAPGAAALAFAMFSGLTVVAAWVLYRNLIASSSVEGRYARASLR